MKKQKQVLAKVKKEHFVNHRIAMHDYESIKYPDLDTKRAVIDKMLADKINELYRIVDELEHKSKVK